MMYSLKETEAVVITPKAIEQRWKWRKPMIVASKREEEKTGNRSERWSSTFQERKKHV